MVKMRHRLVQNNDKWRGYYWSCWCVCTVEKFIKYMLCLLPGAVCYVCVNCDHLSRDLCKLAADVTLTTEERVVVQVDVIYAQLKCCLVTNFFVKTVAAVRIWALQ